jgi:SAM-dependent methyltransferase
MTQRRPLDAYMTPPALALAICRRVADTIWLPRSSHPLRVLEPGAGTGNFVRAAKETWLNAMVTALDINDEYADACLKAGASGFYEGDFLREPFGEPHDDIYDLVIGNPPFAKAEEFVEAALGLAPSVAFLMRAAFRGGARRWRPGGLFSLCPPAVTFPIVPRPSFTGGGTEHSEYELVLFTSQPVQASPVRPIIWKKGR